MASSEENCLRDDPKWSNLGIQFNYATTKDTDKIMDYFYKEFFPDEPVVRSIGLMQGNGFIDKWMVNMMTRIFLKPALEVPHSILATSKEDGRLLGVRLGRMWSKTEKIPKEPNFRWLLNVPQALVPKKMMKMALFQLYTDKCNYDGPAEAFKQLEGSEKIYLALALGVAKEMRGKGLGQELLNRSLELARNNECDHMYILATGNYSQAIFAKAGFVTMHQLDYDDFKDKNGKKIVWDAREHKCSKVVYLKL